MRKAQNFNKKRTINLYMMITPPKTTEEIVDETLRKLFPSLYRK